MKSLRTTSVRTILKWAAGLILALTLWLWSPHPRVFAVQVAPEATATESETTSTNAPTTAEAESSPETNDTVTVGTTTTNETTEPKSDATGTNDEIQVSFQNANVDMIVQWLAKTTGKSVVKHPRVQCQVTIVGSQKLTRRQAINLVYRALELQGFTAVESKDSILIVPEDKEPNFNPILMGATNSNIPEGRQMIVKIFQLNYIKAPDLKDRIRSVLSEKASVDTDDGANQLIVTDYNDNLRLVADLIKELDVPSADMALQTYQVKYGDAEEVGNWLNLILNAKSSNGSSSPSTPSRPPSGPTLPHGITIPGSSSPSPSSHAGGGGTASSAPQVRIWPDKTGNRLIVAAPRARLPEVERLLRILDSDSSRDVMVRVIPLKNLNATDLVREIGSLFQRMGSSSNTREIVQVSASDQSNSLIVLSSEANYNLIKNLIAGLDTEEAQDKITRTFVLKNAEADDVAKQLQDLNQDQNSNTRYIYYFSQPSGSRSKKIRVVADPRRNAVIVQAAPAQMDGIDKMIQELDEPVSDESLAPKIYHLKYVSAVDIEDVLDELFLKKQQTRSYYDLIYEEIYGSSDSSSSQNVGRLYGKVRVTSEPYSNSLIITANSKENLSAVESVIEQLDQPSEAGESTLRIQLKYAKASTVANSINILFAKSGSPPFQQPNQRSPQNNQNNQQQPQRNNGPDQTGFSLEEETKEQGYYPWLGGQPDLGRSGNNRSSSLMVSDLVGRVRAVADPRSNALLISANVHFFPQVLKLVKDLDAQTDQVLIEARLVEVSSDFLDKLGVRWSPNGQAVFTGDDYDNSFLASASSQYQKGYGGNTTVNTPLSAGDIAQAVASLRSGVLSSSISMDFLVQFLRKTTDASVLAEPQINVRNNETGRLFVGQEVPIPENNNVSGIGGNVNTSITYKKVGIVLEVTPHINQSGEVELRVHAESSTVVPGETVLGGAVFDTRSFQTDMRAKDGQTLVLGGIIQKQTTDTLRKTPVLGSIPGLGWAFKKKDKTTRDVELMVFLRPHVVATTQDEHQLLDDLDKTAPLIKKWKDEMRSGDKPRPESKPENKDEM